LVDPQQPRFSLRLRNGGRNGRKDEWVAAQDGLTVRSGGKRGKEGRKAGWRGNGITNLEDG